MDEFTRQRILGNPDAIIRFFSSDGSQIFEGWCERQFYDMPVGRCFSETLGGTTKRFVVFNALPFQKAELVDGSEVNAVVVEACELISPNRLEVINFMRKKRGLMAVVEISD